MTAASPASSVFEFAGAPPQRGPSGPAASAPVTPSVTGAQRGVPTPRCEPHAQCVLAHHDERWAVQGGRLRPDPTQFKLIPGIGGCEAGANGSIRGTIMRANAEDKGWQLIPFDLLPPAEAHRGSYLKSLLASGRPDVTLPYWARAYPGSTALRADLGLKYAFLDHLVDSGFAQPAPIYVIERELDSARSRLVRAEDRAETRPSWRPKVRQFAAEVLALKEALESRLAAAEAADGGPVSPDVSDLLADEPTPSDGPSKAPKAKRKG